MKRYDTADWRALSEAVRNRDRQTCMVWFVLPDTGRTIYVGGCGKVFPMEKLAAAHIVARAEGGIDHPNNLVTLCVSCHASQTAREDGAMGNRRRMSSLNAQLTREEREARTEDPPAPPIDELILPGDLDLEG